MSKEEAVEIRSIVQKFYLRIPPRLKYEVNMIVLTNFTCASDVCTYHRIC
jgi:hypothetical protein